MFDFLADLAVRYGSIGLFTVSMVGSTVFVPFSPDALFILFISFGYNPVFMVLLVALGNLLGTMFNYWIGTFGFRYASRHVPKKELQRGARLMNRYGLFGLFVLMSIPLPIPFDPLTVLCGIVKMNFYRFAVVVFMARVVKCTLLVLGVYTVMGLISLLRHLELLQLN